MKKLTTSDITKTAILIALALTFQMGLRGAGQPLVGPLVNFVLIMSVFLVGNFSGIMVGSITPLVAFMFGMMKLPPLIPFIIIGNILYVITFNYFRKRFFKAEDIISIVISSLIKFGFLAISVRYLVTFFVTVPEPVVAAFTLPQLYTALMGGVLAILVKQFLPKPMLKDN